MGNLQNLIGYSTKVIQMSKAISLSEISTTDPDWSVTFKLTLQQCK